MYNLRVLVLYLSVYNNTSIKVIQNSQIHKILARFLSDKDPIIKLKYKDSILITICNIHKSIFINNNSFWTF